MSKRIFVSARIWTDSNGNSYHSVRVVTDHVDSIDPFAYGYGNHYMVTAGKLLLRDGNGIGKDFQDYAHAATAEYGFSWRWARDNDVKLVIEETRVSRRCDLHNAGKVI